MSNIYLFKTKINISKIILLIVIIIIILKLLLTNSVLIAKVLLDNPRFNNIIYEKIFLPNSSEIVERLNNNDEFEIILKKSNK